MPCTAANTKSGPLVIKYKGTDTGTRPITPCDSTNPYWSSPDIWLDHPSDTTFDEGTFKVGVTNTIKVRLSNITGQDIHNVNVEAFVCDYTAGVGPASSIPGGPGKMTGFASVVPAMSSSTVVGCSPTWTPAASVASINGGHVCLFANCFADDPQEGQSVDFMSTPLPFCCDSHLAQRNVSILTMSKRGLGSGHFGFWAANPDLRRVQDLVVNLRPVALREVLDQSTIQLLETSPFIKRVEIKNGTRLVLIDDQLTKPVPLRVSRLRKFHFRFFPKGAEPGQNVKLKLRPKERRPVRLVLQLDPKEAIAAVRAFDISLTSLKRELLGGVRVVTVTTP